jgi:hypothetical protein
VALCRAVGVPTDPADVLKAMLVEKLEFDSPRIIELRDYFWGGVLIGSVGL